MSPLSTRWHEGKRRCEPAGLLTPPVIALLEEMQSDGRSHQHPCQCSQGSHLPRERWHWQCGFGTFVPVPSSQQLDIRVCRKGLPGVAGERGFGNPHCSSGHSMGVGDKKGTLGPGHSRRRGSSGGSVMGYQDGSRGG